MQKQPIGVFDSGFGGLTVLKEIVAALPQYDYMYLGDNARAPYGPLPFQTVYTYTLEAVKWFFNQGCHLVILACNTASAKALRTIQQNDLPQLAPAKRVLGVIRPTAEVIGGYTKSNHVGIFGTQGTVQSQSYVLEIAKFFPHVQVHQQACPTWVQLVEQNDLTGKASQAEVEKYCGELMQQNSQIDAVLLACTHYPLLQHLIHEAIPGNVKVVSQGNIVARSLQEYLVRHPEIAGEISKGHSRTFFTTGDAATFNAHAAEFFGEPVLSTAVTLSRD